MACDICGETGSALTELRDIYKTPEIQSVCPTCENIINKQLSKLQSWYVTLIARLMKAFMKERKEKA